MSGWKCEGTMGVRGGRSPPHASVSALNTREREKPCFQLQTGFREAAPCSEPYSEGTEGARDETGLGD